MPMSSTARMAWKRNAECIALADDVLAAEGWNERLEMPQLVRAPGQRLIHRQRADERLGVAVVLGDAGGDGEHVGVEDYVFGIEASPVGEQVIGAAANRHLPFGGIGLSCSSKAITTTRRRGPGCAGPARGTGLRLP